MSSMLETCNPSNPLGIRCPYKLEWQFMTRQKPLKRLTVRSMTYIFTDAILAYITLRPRQTRTHCCGHIVAHDVSWARKRAGHKMYDVFPCCASWETFVMFLNKIRNIFCVPTQNLCPQQMLPARANGETFVSATMCLQQCVLVCQGL